jgi:VIT family
MSSIDPSAYPPRVRPRASFVSRHLDAPDRLGEALFGIIMVLTFTLGAGIVVEDGPDATRQMLIGMVGCNIAWGIIDAGMYVLSRLFERSLKLRLFDQMREVSDETSALRIVGGELDQRLESFTTAPERRQLYLALLQRLPNVKLEPVRVEKQDLLSAIAVFWLVTISVAISAVPFAIIDDSRLALRVSNALLLALLFAVGWRCGRETRGRPWLFGAIMLAFGLVMVAVAIALGG